jgi:hypothetical protein
MVADLQPLTSHSTAIEDHMTEALGSLLYYHGLFWEGSRKLGADGAVPLTNPPVFLILTGPDIRVHCDVEDIVGRLSATWNIACWGFSPSTLTFRSGQVYCQAEEPGGLAPQALGSG